MLRIFVVYTYKECSSRLISIEFLYLFYGVSIIAKDNSFGIPSWQKLNDKIVHETYCW